MKQALKFRAHRSLKMSRPGQRWSKTTARLYFDFVGGGFQIRRNIYRCWVSEQLEGTNLILDEPKPFGFWQPVLAISWDYGGQ